MVFWPWDDTGWRTLHPPKHNMYTYVHKLTLNQPSPCCIKIGSGGKAIHLVHILTIPNWQGKTHFVQFFFIFDTFPSTHRQNPEYFWRSDSTSTKSKVFIFLIREMDCTKSSFWWLTCWPWAFQNVQGRCAESGHWSWILSWSHIIMYRHHLGSYSVSSFCAWGW